MGHFLGHSWSGDKPPRTKIKTRTNGKGTRYLAMIEEAPDRFVVVATCNSREYAQDQLDALLKRVEDNTYISQHRNRVTLEWFAENVWLDYKLPKLKRRGKREHVSLLKSRLLPRFGKYKMRDLSHEEMPRLFDQWIGEMVAEGLAPSTIRDYKSALNSILQYAMDEKWLSHNLLKNVWTPPLPDRRKMNIIKPEQWDVIYGELDRWGLEISLFADLKANTGLRFGEIANLRPEMIGETDGVGFVRVQKVVTDAGANYSDDGGRFAEEDTSKGGRDRLVSISDPDTYTNLKRHIAKHNLRAGDEEKPGDLIFSNERMRAEYEEYHPRRKSVLKLAAVPDSVLETPYISPENGRSYSHATNTAYAKGCRCEWCRAAISAYRRGRWDQGLDRKPRKKRKSRTEGLHHRGKNTTDHVEIDWYRRAIWYPVLKKADINTRVRIHDIRHSHLSWMLAAGMTIVEVMERGGHSQITTTQGYLHTLDEVTNDAAEKLAALKAARRKKNLRAVG